MKKKISDRFSNKGFYNFDVRDMILNESTPFNVVEAYKEIRTNLLYTDQKSGCKKIVMTSSSAKEGKTVNAINVALTMAQASKKVLLIDADMRASIMRYYLSVEKTLGLSEYLVGMVDDPNIMKVNRLSDNLDLLLSGKNPLNPAELLMSDKMCNLVKELEKNYDYIFFDTPPIDVVTDATTLINLVDGYIVVVRAEKTDIEALKTTIERLSNLNATVYGFLLDDLDVENKGYGKYRTYYKKKYQGYGRPVKKNSIDIDIENANDRKAKERMYK